ncbi:MAG TPA: AraC family transcriptional regulator [Polyangia bacterium]|jgi:AraC-like DNA-binding protein
MEEIRALNDHDLIVRRAVELCRDTLGLRHARIGLLDRSLTSMRGTWGMDLSGAVIDERAVTLEIGGSDREAVRRLEHEGAHFTVFDHHPIVDGRGGQRHVVGTGWVAKTPIRSTREPIAMLVNDAGMTDAGVDEIKQTHAAILCSMLGELLAPTPRRFARSAPAEGRAPERVVASTVAMLERDPALAGKELAASLNVQLSYLSSVFRILVGMSVTDYRNQLRFARFQALLGRGGENVKSAARQAGFGSYAQFHRVFRAHARTSPREYLRRTRAERDLRP